MQEILNNVNFNSQTWVMLYALVIDVATGVGSAVVHRRLKSKTFRDGLIQHFMIAVIVVSLNSMTNAQLDPSSHAALSTLYTLFVTGFTLTYAISVIENLDQMGIKVPQAITKYLANSTGGENNESKDN
mgnify:FL=1